MATEMSSNSWIVSPRISFSHDLKEETDSRKRTDSLLLESEFNFDFDFKNSFVQEILLSSADELFRNGKILPTQVKKPNPQNPVRFSSQENKDKKLLKEFLLTDSDDEETIEPSTMPNKNYSFWQFKRSFSLNSDFTRSKSRMIRSSLLFLSRSNSTGSTPHEAQSHRRPNENQERKLGSVSGPSLRQCGSYGNNNDYCVGRSSPVLNIPDPHICRAVISLFCNGKLKNKKR